MHLRNVTVLLGTLYFYLFLVGFCWDPKINFLLFFQHSISEGFEPDASGDCSEHGGQIDAARRLDREAERPHQAARDRDREQGDRAQRHRRSAQEIGAAFAAE